MDLIEIKMNGKRIFVREKIFIQKFIEDWVDDYKEKRIAVALNNEVIAKEKWSKIKLNDKDSLEIVTAFPGG